MEALARVETPLSEIERMAQYMTKSQLFGIKTAEQAISLMLIAQAEGTHPALAARDYHIIQGRPTLKADAMLARFQQAGGKVEWQEYSDKRVAGLFSSPGSPKPVLIEWTIKMAEAAHLTGKEVWKQYPRQMLRARCVSEGIRTTAPGVAVGIYTPEEVQDFDEKPKREPVHLDPIRTETPPQNEPEHTPDQPRFISEAQRKLLFAKSKNAGITPADLKMYLQENFAISSTNEIHVEIFDEILNYIAGFAESTVA